MQKVYTNDITSWDNMEFYIGINDGFEVVYVKRDAYELCLDTWVVDYHDRHFAGSEMKLTQKYKWQEDDYYGRH